MTNDYYLKQAKSMCEIKLEGILAKNPQPKKRLNRNSNNPLY